MLFGMAALVVDLGIARDNRRQAQNTADSAALAAANALYAKTAPDLNKPGDFAAAVYGRQGLRGQELRNDRGRVGGVRQP